MKKLLLLTISLIIVFILVGCSGSSESTISDSPYSVSGQIIDFNGNPVEGVELLFSGRFGTATTDINGNWIKTELHGEVKITPVKENYEFSPENRIVSGIVSNIKFTGTPIINSPMIISVPKISTTSAEIKWTTVEDATKYEIYRSEDDESYQRIKETDDIEIIDNGLDAGKKYYYKVNAIDTNRGLESGLSDNITLLTPTSGTMEIGDNVKVFSQGQIKKLLLEQTSNKIILKINKKTALLKTGDIILCEFTNESSYINNKIKSIEKLDDKITIWLEEIDIEDIVGMLGEASFNEKIDDTISLQILEKNKAEIEKNITQSLGLTRSVQVEFKKVGNQLEMKVTHLPLDYPIVEQSLTFYVDNTVERVFNRNQWYLKMDTGFRLKYDFGIGTPYNSELWLETLKKKQLGVNIKLTEIPLVKGYFTIGIIPIQYIANLPIHFIVEGKIKGTAHMGYETKRYIQTVGFDIRWNDLTNSDFIYEWNSEELNTTGFNTGFLFSGELKVGFSQKLSLNIWEGEILKAGVEEYLLGKLSYQLASSSGGAKGGFSKAIKIDAKVESGEFTEKILKGININKLDYTTEVASIGLGSGENIGPTLEFADKEDGKYLEWNQSKIFTSITSIETNRYKVLRKDEEFKEWKIYRIIDNSQKNIDCLVDKGGTYKVVPIFSFYGEDYHGLESNIVKIENETSTLFPDPKFEGVIREAINMTNGIISKNDVIDIERLYGGKNDISSIEGIQYLKNLSFLSIFDNQIRDINPISNLSNINYLRLGHNQINDISSISTLYRLNYLILRDNNISNITPLKDLTNLNSLSLNNNQISDIGPLENLINLETLYLQDNQISDISSLRYLKNLKWLGLANNQISDITPLSNLNNIYLLYLDNNNINDLTPIKGLNTLTSIQIGNNKISNIEPLANLRSLNRINLSQNDISDISILSNFKKLSYIDLSYNQISDGIDIFLNLDYHGLPRKYELEYLDLRYNKLNISEGSHNMQIIRELISRGCLVKYKPQN
ncbi:MAG: leucine-rich repeat domain-containing protein [bacterium]